MEKSGNVWVSPPHAPFGGIQCDVGCQESELVFLLGCIKHWVQSQSGEKLVVKTAPSCYYTTLDSLRHIPYLITGFIPIQTCLNSFISVSSSDFYAQIRPAERRRLKKASNSGFEAGLASGLASSVIYEFLEKCRNQMGYRISLTLSQLETLRQNFPDRYLIFTVMAGSEIVALTLTVRANSRVLYNFLCSDMPAYRAYSPTVMLMEAVYNYCRQQNIEILDLGISLDQNGDFKPSLHRFKKNIGGQDCLKLTYEMNFANQIPRQFPSL
ncbi:GNAT family N-acetyltransferase [Dyadobacter fanqingshengii]|uniref:GNAT family N-acetyltransferase n=1 Tax=Dyadobacter fanqingshengii TaxID=2906443 RepID=A0A9X1T8V5_9BACT|nr:GNAT family N-acetyltransferase [Dyadobacter fanqingshengii]MCF0039289.1 GNAT family N-acetyltransferase [Dyadobacter fanqingshengii]USJ33894.1 GNAT family N-acetyltransferase [Dyadobacter fanqingshengii]